MHWIERHWSRVTLLTLALAPLSVVFAGVVGLRRWLYAKGALQVSKLPVPVLIVGNISIGGTGKTPLVLWLVDLLRQSGYRPGIVSRGYGGDGNTRAVTPQSNPTIVGDEPLLLYKRSQVPVYVGSNRVLAAQSLLSEHPECDILISDDGLQHYALHRDLEITVVDGERGFGNGLLLPAGPLREQAQRLDEVDAIVCNGASTTLSQPYYVMALEADQWHNVAEPHHRCAHVAFSGKSLHAVAGIGNPPRFFQLLREVGLNCAQHPFPDHHPFRREDFEFAHDDIVLMTEKDAVKCAAFAKPNWWYLPVTAQVDPALRNLILSKIRAAHGRKAP